MVSNNNNNNNNDHHIFLIRRTATGVLMGAVIVAVLMTKIEVVLGLNGSLFGSLIMFFIPGLIYVV